MKCYLCGAEGSEIQGYNTPDKYELSAGVKRTSRAFYRCEYCEFIWQEGALSGDSLVLAYNRYRDEGMRKVTIKEEFDRIIDLPESENTDRVDWLKENFTDIESLLDIGSGLGVFPYAVNQEFNNPTIICIELCAESVNFIRDYLGFKCLFGMYSPEITSVTEMTSMVHVLEHMPDPRTTLLSLKSKVLFIEVPDVKEFDTLSPDHDEFNSTHLWFFNVSTLDRLCRQAGWTPYMIERVHYHDRNLDRIRMLCSLSTLK